MEPQLIHELFGEDSDDEYIDGLVIQRSALQYDVALELASTLNFIPSEGINQKIIFGKIPEEFSIFVDIGQKLFPSYISLRKPLFDQMIANYYEPGEGLIAHIDLVDRFQDGILVANLKGTTTLQFTNDLYPNKKVEVFLDVGDVILLYGSARWEWKHGIESNAYDIVEGNIVQRSERVSLTLRKLKEQDHS
jgi:hypothetical protein